MNFLSYTLDCEKSLISHARDFAEFHHKGQVRRYTGEPYFSHVKEVAKIVEDTLCFRGGVDNYKFETIMSVAYLHDTIEDCDITLEDVYTEFGEIILNSVLQLSNRELGSRRERKRLERVRLSGASPDIQLIKCADIISNTRSIIKYDAKFAKVYIPEKILLLKAMKDAGNDIRFMTGQALGIEIRG